MRWVKNWLHFQIITLNIVRLDGQLLHCKRLKYNINWWGNHNQNFQQQSHIDFDIKLKSLLNTFFTQFTIACMLGENAILYSIPTH